MYLKFIKPLLDFLVAFFAFLFLSPVFIVVMVLLYVKIKGSPFFYQMRPGKDGKTFKIVKFKTMTDAKDVDGNLLPDAERLTSIGTFIRSTSLDEMPQLLNVIKGDMSIVGPRPLLVHYLELYNETQKKRHDVKPGITGWAQINGRNTISWDQKFDLDVFYVQNVTFALDIKVLFKTVQKVIQRKDINNQDAATMEAFKGTKD